MIVRLLVPTLLVLPAVAAAQVDEWSTFPSDPPVATSPAPASPAAPATPAATPAAARDDKDGKKEKKDKQDRGAQGTVPARATVSKTAPQAAPAPPIADLDAAPVRTQAGEPVVVAQEERLVPGSTPHSPSTLGNAWNALENRRVASSVVGASGLMNSSSAIIGQRGIVRFSVAGEYHSLRDFPVRDAINIRTAGTFSASMVVLPWLETYLAYAASANTNNFSSPTLIQALGDLSLGAKASREWVRGLYAGLDLRLMSFSGVGNQDVGRYAWGIAPKAVFSWDIRTAAPNVPLLVHGNVGFHFDSTGGLVRNHPLNAAEEYALNVNRYNRFAAGLGLEAPLPVVTPFVEWNVGVPLGVPNGLLTSPDGRTRVGVGAVLPHTLALGARVTAVRDVTFTAGVQLGLTRSVGLGVPATPPYNLYLGASYAIDPFRKADTKYVETLRERTIETEVKVPEPPKMAKVEGVVIDASTQQPIPGVIVAAVGANLPPVASDAQTGRFLTHDLAPGPVTLKVEKAGYAGTEHTVTLAAGQTASVQLALQPLAKVAHFLVSAAGGPEGKKAPIAAEVKLKGPVEQTLTTQAGSAEPSKLDVPPGRYVLTVVAPEHLAQTREVQVSENAEMRLHFDLEPEPKKKLVVVKTDRIEILQQVHFEFGKARILPRSHGLLRQVIDAIVKHDIKRIRVEGHTDNVGGKARNQALSEERARAVADYLVSQGIDRSRIVPVGYGDSKPVAPNLTARGRELNRRVEFHILER